MLSANTGGLELQEKLMSSLYLLFLLQGMLKDVEDELQRKVKVFVLGQF